MTETDEHDGAGIWRDPSGIAALGEPTESTVIGQAHKACVVLCCSPPRRKRRSYCPGCGGKVTVKPLQDADVEPEPGRLAALIAGVRQGIRDAERLLARWEKRPPVVELPCPVCEAAEWREMAQALISECGEHVQAEPGEAVSEAKECQECDL